MAQIPGGYQNYKKEHDGNTPAGQSQSNSPNQPPNASPFQSNEYGSNQTYAAQGMDTTRERNQSQNNWSTSNDGYGSNGSFPLNVDRTQTHNSYSSLVQGNISPS